MKTKTVSVLFLAFALLLLTACTTRNDNVLGSVGQYTEICFYTHGEFQDYTDYAKYRFEDPALENNRYLKRINEETKQSFEAHLDQYEPLVRENGTNDIPYDFDRGMITDTDYLYIYDDPDHPEFGNYSIWFFDHETSILYYFHANI